MIVLNERRGKLEHNYRLCAIKNKYAENKFKTIEIMSKELVKTETINDSQLIGYLDTMGLTSKLNNNEKTQYLEICKAFGLNPFKREIYVSKYGEQMSIITGYEVYIKRAERSGQLDGWQVTTEGSIKDDNLKAIVTIYRKDRKHPFVWEAYYKEFVQKTREGKVTKFWEKAEFMIKKVAIAQGFRLCFSDELGGMPYTQDELPETLDVKHEVIHTEVKEEPKVNQVQLDTDVTKTFLEASESLDDLVSKWKTLTTYQKNLPGINELKESLKAKFNDGK